MINCEVNKQEKNSLTISFIEDVVKVTFQNLKICLADISIVFVSPIKIKQFNKKYRGKNQPTDILSFCYAKKPLSGEIVICFEIAKKQAKEEKITVKKRIAILLVHGLLHLSGYNHKKESDYKKMFQKENEILAKLKKF